MTRSTVHPYARPAALAGGLFFCVHYLINLSYGVRTGKVLFAAEEGGLLVFGAGVALFAGYIALAVALYGIARSFRRRARFSYRFTVALSALTFMSSVLGLGGALLLTGTSLGRAITGLTATVSLFAVMLTSILAGFATWRVSTLPDWIGIAVSLFGLLTLPVWFAAVRFGSILPMYVWSQAQFALAGIVWLAIGIGLKQRVEHLAVA